MPAAQAQASGGACLGGAAQVATALKSALSVAFLLWWTPLLLTTGTTTSCLPLPLVSSASRRARRRLSRSRRTAASSRAGGGTGSCKRAARWRRTGELASQRTGGSEVGGGDQRSQLCASREIDRGGKDRERDWGERRRSVAAANVEGEHEIGGRGSRLSARRWNGGAVSTCAMALHPRLAPAGEFGVGGERGGPVGRDATDAWGAGAASIADAG
ncbi:hypothetical protein ZEAMMB73_Zm00001d049792 [Zea mays]|uniref:Uncharacterized protein n=1 Tax=Zea mays TaxID=4577 RepID=K7U232_MAIZE|nr:hypothetical protein ZEAMMB73_Zm00001d049792 [Zea mays]